MTINYQPYIIRDSAICGGKPVVKGTRVTVCTMLGSLVEGMTVTEILPVFLTLDENAMRAVIAFAAVSAEEDLCKSRHYMMRCLIVCRRGKQFMIMFFRQPDSKQ